MPRYLLKQAGQSGNQGVFEHIQEAWFDGYAIAGRALQKHPIKVTQARDLSLNVTLDLPPHMRLSSRSLRQDALDHLGALQTLSATPDLSDTSCVLYDTDRPWDQDPILLGPSGTQTPIPATGKRPSEKAEEARLKAEAAAQAAAQAAGQTAGQAAGQSGPGNPGGAQSAGGMAPSSLLTQAQALASQIQGTPTKIAFVPPSNPGGMAQTPATAAALQTLLSGTNLQSPPPGFELVDLLDEEDYEQLEAFAAQNLPYDWICQAILQSVVAAGYYPQQHQINAYAAKLGVTPAGSPTASQTVQITPAVPGAALPAGGPGGLTRPPTQAEIDAFTDICHQNGGDPAAIISQMQALSGSATSSPQAIQAALSKHQLNLSKSQVKAQGAAAFAGASWIYRLLNEPHLRAEGLAVVQITAAADPGGVEEELTDLIGDDLPETFFEESPGRFVAEMTDQQVRAALEATGIFQEDR